MTSEIVGHLVAVGIITVIEPLFVLSIAFYLLVKLLRIIN